MPNIVLRNSNKNFNDLSIYNSHIKNKILQLNIQMKNAFRIVSAISVNATRTPAEKYVCVFKKTTHDG